MEQRTGLTKSQCEALHDTMTADSEAESSEDSDSDSESQSDSDYM